MIAVASLATNSAGSGTVIIDKPTGLQVGDLLVADLSHSHDGNSTIATASGWTSLVSASDLDGGVHIQWKIADSGDVAASNFTFTANGSNAGFFGGAVLRVTGNRASAGGDSDSEGNATGTTTLTFTSSMTPAFDGALVVIALASYSGVNNNSISSFFTTPAVALTEAYNLNVNNLPERLHIGGAYGVQTTAAEITSFGAIYNNAQNGEIGAIGSFYASVDAQGNNVFHAVSPTYFNQAGLANAQSTNNLLEVSPTINEANGRAVNKTQWTNESNPSTSWTNEQQ